MYAYYALREIKRRSMPSNLVFGREISYFTNATTRLIVAGLIFIFFAQWRFPNQAKV